MLYFGILIVLAMSCGGGVGGSSNNNSNSNNNNRATSTTPDPVLSNSNGSDVDALQENITTEHEETTTENVEHPTISDTTRTRLIQEKEDRLEAIKTLQKTETTDEDDFTGMRARFRHRNKISTIKDNTDRITYIDIILAGEEEDHINSQISTLEQEISITDAKITTLEEQMKPLPLQIKYLTIILALHATYRQPLQAFAGNLMIEDQERKRLQQIQPQLDKLKKEIEQMEKENGSALQELMPMPDSEDQLSIKYNEVKNEKETKEEEINKLKQHNQQNKAQLEKWRTTQPTI